MKNLWLYLSRMFLIGILILIQFLIVLFSYLLLVEAFAVVQTLFSILGVIAFFIIVNKDQSAVYKLPWVIFFLLFPLGAFAVYDLFGNRRMTKKQLKKLTITTDDNIDSYYNQSKILDDLKEDDLHCYGQAMYLKNMTNLPLYSNSYTEFLNTGENFYDCLKAHLRGAKRYIFMEYFIIAEGEMWNGIHEILKQKVAEGVEVRVMYDDLGSMYALPSNFDQKLRNEGIKAYKYNKFMPIMSIAHNNRDHRKITVIDGEVGFMGGVNIGDEYINVICPFGRWRDSAILIKGQAVDSLIRLFTTLYNTADNVGLKFEKYIQPNHIVYDDGYVMPFGDSPAPITDEHIGENNYLNIINQSKKYLYIASPYLICDTNILDALKRASNRGVLVRMILPERADKKIVKIMTKSNYLNLMKAGVEIYEFKEGFIHSKTMLADDTVGIVGTINLDYRSFVHHFECATWLYKTKSIITMKSDFDNLFKNECTKMTENTARLTTYERIIKSLTNIFAPLM